MKNLTVINNSSNNIISKCSTCASTKQMKNSKYCSSNITKIDDQVLPECFINVQKASQSERNFLMCPTFNLGLYEVCKTCPLECPQNISKEKSIFDFINIFGNVLGLNENTKENLSSTFEKLNNEDFKEIYLSLENISKAIRIVINKSDNSPDLTKKIIELENKKIKQRFDELIDAGKITPEQAQLYKTNIHSSENMIKLKSLIEELKRNKVAL